MYDNNTLVTVEIVGSLTKFNGSALNQVEDSSINVKTVGKEQDSLRWSSWIHNVSPKYNVVTFRTLSSSSYELTLNAEHSLYFGDEIEIVDADGVILNGSVVALLSDTRVSVTCGTLSELKEYYVRRKIKTNLSASADVQNLSLIHI